MNKANQYLLEVIEKIAKEGVSSPPEHTRAYYLDAEGNKKPATTKYILNWNEEYDLQKGESPIVDIRPIGVHKAIGELLWMYQDKSNVVRYTYKDKPDTPDNNTEAEKYAQSLGLDVSLEGKYGVMWWREWTYQEEVIGTGLIKHHIGDTYGSIIKEHNPLDKIRTLMKKNPYNRRAICNMWQYDEIGYIFGEDNTTTKEAKLPPCFYSFHLDVRTIEGITYLDLKLEGRSSDYLLASNQDRIQYVAMLLMLANELGFKPGKLYVNYMNVHIYENQWDAVDEILSRLKTRKQEETANKTLERNANTLLNLQGSHKVAYKGRKTQPKLVLNASEGTDFYDIVLEDFVLEGYEPMRPNVKIPKAI